MYTTVPVKHSFKHPWIDGEVRHLQTWAAAKRTNAQMWNKCLRSKLKVMLRDKGKRFMSDLAQLLKNNAKRFWTFCRLNVLSSPALVLETPKCVKIMY